MDDTNIPDGRVLRLARLTSDTSRKLLAKRANIELRTLDYLERASARPLKPELRSRLLSAIPIDERQFEQLRTFLKKEPWVLKTLRFQHVLPGVVRTALVQHLSGRGPRPSEDGKMLTIAAEASASDESDLGVALLVLLKLQLRSVSHLAVALGISRPAASYLCHGRRLQLEPRHLVLASRFLNLDIARIVAVGKLCKLKRASIIGTNGLVAVSKELRDEVTRLISDPAPQGETEAGVRTRVRLADCRLGEILQDETRLAIARAQARQSLDR